VHKIRVDTANNKLRAIAPEIRQRGVNYEISHFDEKIDKGTITMERTNKWIKHTVEQLLQHKDPVVNIKCMLNSETRSQRSIMGETFEMVVHDALVSLVTEYPNWGGEKRGKDKEDELPETMMLDLLRVKALNVHFHTDVVSAIILTQVDQVTAASPLGAPHARTLASHRFKPVRPCGQPPPQVVRFMLRTRVYLDFVRLASPR
jgi:hypothetical protein